MAKTHIHHGPHSSVPSSASPGLLFLKAFLPALDSLSPDLNPITPFCKPTARFIINNKDGSDLDTLVAMFQRRSQGLEIFQHEVKSVWDVELEDPNGKRTVMFESVSVSVFKSDPERKRVEVPEFSIIELERTEDGVGVEGLGLVATELRVYMDAKPVMQRMSELAQAQR